MEKPIRHAGSRWRAATLAGLLALPVAALAQSEWLRQGQEALESLSEPSGAAGLSDADIRSGLKEALRVGTESVVGRLGRTDGFYADPEVRIPLPGALQSVYEPLERLGMSSMLDDLQVKLNRAAEEATPKAKRLFWDAIAEMTLDDVRAIYDAPEDAATRYFERTMSAPLAAEMRPVVDRSLSEVGAVQSYDRFMGEYERLPFVPDVSANLTGHVVEEAIDGIFFYLAREEAAIRRDPAKRTTDLLRRVFGSR